VRGLPVLPLAIGTPSAGNSPPSADAMAPCSCRAGPGAQDDAGGVEVTADGLGMHAELAADSGAGPASEIVLLGLALLLVAQTARPTGNATGVAEVADLLLADAIALADLSHWHTLLVQGDHLILLRWRKAGVMLAQALRRGSGYGGRSGSVVGGSSGGDFALRRQLPGELQQRLPVLGDGRAEGHHKLPPRPVADAVGEVPQARLANRWHWSAWVPKCWGRCCPRTMT